MSAIGNFDIASPPQAVADAFARLFAWKLSMYGIRADASRVYVKNRYMQAINGHRDAGSTACPGRDTCTRSSRRSGPPRSGSRTGRLAAGPAYTGDGHTDPRCTAASINRRSYRRPARGSDHSCSYRSSAC